MTGTRDLGGLAAAVAALLEARRETVAIAESSAGGLISAALVAIPGASAYFLGGGVIYTRAARRELLGDRRGKQLARKFRSGNGCPPMPLLVQRVCSCIG